MQVSLIVLAVVILAAGIVDSKAEDVARPEDVVSLEGFLEEEKVMLQEETDKVDEDEIVFSDDVVATEEGDVAEVTPEETVLGAQEEDEFLYPGARVIEDSGGVMVLESSDSTQEITDWYKDRILEMGFSVKNFITTSSNGKVLNKLSGAGVDGSVSIAITRQSVADVAVITIEFSSN